MRRAFISVAFPFENRNTFKTVHSVLIHRVAIRYGWDSHIDHRSTDQMTKPNS